LSPATQTYQYQNTDFTSGDDPGPFLDQYLGKNLILEEGNDSNNDCQKGPQGLMFSMILIKIK
jgi:hypothetical protein